MFDSCVTAQPVSILAEDTSRGTADVLPVLLPGQTLPGCDTLPTSERSCHWRNSPGRHSEPPPFTGAVTRGAELRNLQCGGICECGGWDDDVSDDTSTATIVANSGTSGWNWVASLEDVMSCNWLGGNFIPASANAWTKHCAIGYAVSSLVAKCPAGVMPQGKWRCFLDSPGHNLDNWLKATWLWASTVFFWRLLPYWQLWKMVYLSSFATLTQKVVAQNKENCGFSTQTIMLCLTAYFTIWAVKWYSLLAWLIFILLTKERSLKPLGLLLSRGGSGALPFRFSLIDRARLAVPHGGAKNTPTTRGFFNQLASMSRPLLVVRSIKLIVATQFLGLTWSTPKDDDRPNCLRHAVTLPVPQKTSMTKAS